jgi:hypothetical protein
MGIAYVDPHQRTVPAICATAAGWLRGNFHVPRQQSFADFLVQSGAFLPLTDAQLPPHDAPLPFFAVQRAGLRFIVPDPAEAHIQTVGAGGITSPWSVACVFAEGLVEGYIDFVTNQRLSDYLPTLTRPPTRPRGHELVVRLMPARRYVPVAGCYSKLGDPGSSPHGQAPTPRTVPAPPQTKVDEPGTTRSLPSGIT